MSPVHKYNEKCKSSQSGRPTLLNAMAGLVSTMVNIYTAQSGAWSIMAMMTVIATGLTMAVSIGLTIAYKLFKLETIKREHEAELKAGFHRVLPKPSESIQR